MKNKVLTFNVILSTDPALMESALSLNSLAEITSDSRFKAADNFKFFTLNKNKSLISFNYEFSKDNGIILQLEFLDYDGFFEFNFISSNINDFIVNYLNRDTIRKDKNANPNPFSIFYIAFGTGSDLKDWTGPHMCYLIKSEYEFTQEGSKKITLTFYPSEDSLNSALTQIQRTNNQHKKNTLATDLIHKYYSNFDNITDLDEFERALFENKVLYPLIKNYLKAYTGLPESIVLVPDIDRYSGPYEEYKNATSQEEALRLAMSIFGLSFSRKTKTVESSVVPIQEKVMEDEAKKSEKPVYKLEMTTTTTESNETRGGTLNRIVDPYIALQKMAQGLNQLIVKKAVSPYNLTIENDKKVLKLWKSTGLITDDSQPVAVWGRDDYVQSLLYPKLRKPLWEYETDLIPVVRSKLVGSTYYASLHEQAYNHTYNSNFSEDIGADLSEFTLSKIYDFDVTSETIKNQKIPLFKSNLKNPNVLDYVFTNWKSDVSILATAIQIATSYAINDSAKLIEKNEEVYRKMLNYASGDILAYIDSKYGSNFTALNQKRFQSSIATRPVTVNGKKYFDNLTNTMKIAPSQEAYRKFITYIFEKKEEAIKSAYGSVFVSNMCENKSELQQRLNTLLSDRVVNLNIRTLPFFSLTGNKYIGYPCVFIQKLFKGWISPLSGIYGIMGIRHVVNSDEMYSEFTLTKSVFGNSQPTTVPNN